MKLASLQSGATPCSSRPRYCERRHLADVFLFPRFPGGHPRPTPSPPSAVEAEPCVPSRHASILAPYRRPCASLGDGDAAKRHHRSRVTRTRLLYVPNPAKNRLRRGCAPREAISSQYEHCYRHRGRRINRIRKCQASCQRRVQGCRH